MSMSLIPSTTSLPWPGALIPRSIIIEKSWDKTEIRYSAEAYIYCSAKPSVFYHVVLNVDVSTFCSFNSSVKRLMCVVVVVASCFLSSGKNNETLHGVDMVFCMSLFMSVAMHWNFPIQYP